MKALFLSIFLFISILCNAQLNQFRTEAVATRLYNHVEEKFPQFSQWESNNILIVFNEVKETIIIYSEFEQHYAVISMVLIEEGKANILTFDCIDNYGERVKLEVVHLTPEIYHLYIRMKEMQIVYQMKKI